ncbi:hypothetical protein PSE_3076 [Pseudovibrio sp. FO-BEG1]|uniref:hypothetical protein n=1 Tax=Pseudovibrio sp. (strain FO-BEG1) TaxID=911045 RepID=UPI000238D3B4|nr:hypothetical protein [Pseudovibrio sp. FO-BEG1]AEV37584.1 hypothetical protein PSE_3076 [Pseudovibrio sp. FO-BEG1]
MSLIKKRMKLALAATAFAAMLGIQNASAQRSILVQADICQDVYPLGIFTVHWLTATNQYDNLYFMDAVGQVFSLIPNSPPFENTTDLWVHAHGNCGAIGQFTADQFGRALDQAFPNAKPERVVLASCMAGTGQGQSPVSVVSEALGQASSVTGWDGSVGVRGNGSQQLADFSYGLARIPLDEWEQDVGDIGAAISNLWTDVVDGVPNQTNCTDALMEAMAPVNPQSFIGFVNATAEFFSNDIAAGAGSDYTEALSKRYSPGVSVCGRDVPVNLLRDDPNCVFPD